MHKIVNEKGVYHTKVIFMKKALTSAETYDTFVLQ